MARQRHPRGIDDGDGITDDELLDVASNIAPNDYFRVGLQLDITYRVLDNTKRQHRDNYINSMHEILHLWKDRQGPEINTREELYQRLRVVGLDQDGNRLRIVPNRPAMSKCIVGLATAVLLIAFYICILLQGTGFEGCASSPCLYEGTCIDLDRTFKCICKDGFGGSRCEEECVVGDLTLSQFQDLLRDEYKRSLFKIKIKPWDPYDYVDLENFHTVVSLNKKDKINIPNKPEQKITLSGSINDVFQTKIGGKLPGRIVLVGEAGRGKTTAVAKMAYDWVNRVDGSPLKEVPLLFVLKMRHLKNTTNLAEGVLRLLGQKYVKDVEYHTQLKNWIDSHEKDVFILMDGYDEYSGGLQAHDLVSDVIDILLQKSCNYCKVLVTTRPFKETDFTDLDSTYYATMELEGYSEEHAMFFIDKFFEPINETKGTELKRYLEDEPVMREMITTPLFCTMMCYMWGEDRFYGSYTRTAFFDNIMDFLLEHTKSKKDTNGMTTTEESIKLDDLLIHVGGVAYYRMLDPYRTDSLHFTDRDFIKNQTLKILCYRIGLLTETVTYDEEAVVYIKFFHKSAQEYAAGKYLSNQLKKNIAFLSNVHVSNTISMEVLQFASGTSDVACKIILHDEIQRTNEHSPRSITYVLKLISEADKCAANSESNLTSFFRSQRHLQLNDLRTIIGFGKLPTQVKNEVTVIYAQYLSGPVFKRLWRNLYSCTRLFELSINAIVLPNDLANMKPLTMVKCFVVYVDSPRDFNTEIFSLLPNLEIFKEGFSWGIKSAIFTKVWNKLSNSSHLSQLTLSIPSIAPSELIALTSVQRFETCIRFSPERVIGILPKLPNINVFVIKPKVYETDEELVVTFEGFSELWSNLSILQHLHRIELFLPPYILSASSPFTTVIVQVSPWHSTKTQSSGSLLNVLAEIPNIHELIIHVKVSETDEELVVTFEGFSELWSNLSILQHIHQIELFLPPYILSASNPFTTVIVQVSPWNSTKNQSSGSLLNVLAEIPNIHELIIHADLFEEMDTDESHKFFRKFWRILNSYTNLTTLRLVLSRAVPRGLEKLTKIKTFQARVKLDPSVLSGILDRLPSVQALIAISDNERGPNLQFHDVFLSTLTDSVMKRKIRLKGITVSFVFSYLQGKTISRDTVRKFINMLKSSQGMQHVNILCESKAQWLFKESDVKKLLKALHSISSLQSFNISCGIDATDELR